MRGNRSSHSLGRRLNATGKHSGKGGREGSAENTRGLSGRAEALRRSVLRHERDRGHGPDLPDEGFGKRLKPSWPGFRLTTRRSRKFLTWTNYYGQAVEIDGQGRILIPPVLREAAPDERRCRRERQPDLSGSSRNHARSLENLKKSQLTEDDWKTLDDLGI